VLDTDRGGRPVAGSSREAAKDEGAASTAAPSLEKC